MGPGALQGPFDLVLDVGLKDVPAGRRVLVLIPDGTRHAPIPMLFRLLCESLGRRAKRLDFLIALGTHPPMSEDAVDRLVGMPASERRSRYPNTFVINHQWDRPEQLTRIGAVSAGEIEELTDGLVREEMPVDINRLIFDYDQLLISGPVFPHEVAGFSGGAKYLIPGIAGPEVISITHWVGALVSSMRTIGVKDTAVRRLIHRAAALVPKPILCIAFVVRGSELHGLWIGGYQEAWSKSRRHVRKARDHPSAARLSKSSFDAIANL